MSVDIEAHERADRRSYLTAIIGLLLVVGVGVLIYLQSARDQQTAATADTQKYSLAQQVAAACVATGTDDETLKALCANAQTIVQDGKPGADGTQGPQGIPGLQGPRGPSGLDGLPGPIGPTGPPGVKGDTGLTGAVGLTGSAGADGLAGAQGDAGPAGAVGAAGPAGPAGPAGAPGTNAPNPTGQSATCAEAGDPANQGDNSLTVTTTYSDGSTTSFTYVTNCAPPPPVTPTPTPTATPTATTPAA